MIIHEPETCTRDGYTTIWSRLEIPGRQLNIPDYLWFRVPEYYAQYVSGYSNAFIVPALFAAMYFDEKLQVRGTASPRLAYHLAEYQFIQSFSFPKFLKPVELQFEKLMELDASPSAVATGFSAGVDSLHTIHQHLPEHQPNPEYQITHAIFINGFDIRQEEREKYERLFVEYRDVLSKLNIELIPVESNAVLSVLPHLEYRTFYVPSLFGPAMLFDKLFKRFIATNSREYSQPQVTSAPLPDRLLSTETLDMDHFGATIRREEKIKVLSDWPIAQKLLRVCGSPGQKIINCSRCEKCVRTMLPLYALGKLGEFKTFADPLRSDMDGLRLARKYDPYSDHVPMNVKFFKEHRPSILPWLWIASFFGSIRFWLLRLLPGFIKKWLGRYGYFIDKIKQENAFDNPAIISLIRSVGSPK